MALHGEGERWQGTESMVMQLTAADIAEVAKQQWKLGKYFTVGSSRCHDGSFAVMFGSEYVWVGAATWILSPAYWLVNRIWCTDISTKEFLMS